MEGFGGVAILWNGAIGGLMTTPIHYEVRGILNSTKKFILKQNTDKVVAQGRALPNHLGNNRLILLQFSLQNPQLTIRAEDHLEIENG